VVNIDRLVGFVGVVGVDGLVVGIHGWVVSIVGVVVSTVSL